MSSSTVNVLLTHQGTIYEFYRLIGGKLHPFTMCFNSPILNNHIDNDMTSTPTIPFIFLVINLFSLFINAEGNQQKNAFVSHLSYKISSDDLKELNDIAGKSIHVSKENNSKVFEILKRYYSYFLNHIELENNGPDELESNKNKTKDDEQEGKVKNIGLYANSTSSSDHNYIEFESKLRQTTNKKNSLLKLTFNFNASNEDIITHENIKKLIADAKLDKIKIDGDLNEILSFETTTSTDYSNNIVKCLNFAENLFKEQKLKPQVVLTPKEPIKLWVKLVIMFSIILLVLLLILVLYFLLKTKKQRDTILSLAPIGK